MQSLKDKVSMTDAARRRVEWRFQPWTHYDHVTAYLRFAQAGLAGRGVKINWFDDPLTAEQFRKAFLEALHKRITCKGELPRGRKWDSEYLVRLNQERWFNKSQNVRRMAAS